MSDDKMFKPITNSEGFIALEIAPEELKLLIDLLSLSKDTFISKAADALDKEAGATFDQYTEYAKLAENFHNKFGTLAQIGEPEYRGIH